MSKRTYLPAGLLGLLLLAIAAFALLPGSARAADATWHAAYYNNMTLSGTPVLERQENAINYDWGENAPTTGINADRFSARWSRTVNLPAGNYRFSATMDDGMRVWVDGALIIDAWYDSQAHTVSVDRQLSAGDHQIRVEYYENGKDAVARFSWQLVPVTIRNWRGEYFDNTSLSGSPRLVRDDANVDFNWGDGAPASGLDRDNFSVRWTRNVTLPPGQYRFTARTDDGVRLWVNNQLIVDQWHTHAVQSYSGEITLYGGPVPVKMEYFERTGLAEAHLTWTQLISPPTGGPGAGTATVSSYALNVRSGPGINYNVIGVLGRGTVVNLVGYRNAGGNWIMVARANGAQGWIHAGYVQTSVPVSSLAVWNGSGAPPGNATATVTSYFLNVRSGPGVANNVLAIVARGDRLTLTHRNAQANWVRVTLANGTQGWVHAGYIQSSAPLSTLPVWSN